MLAASHHPHRSIYQPNDTSMGIDIYTRWKGQRGEEETAQFAAFSLVHGHIGYLREAYHGEPYATRFLCYEAFINDSGRAPIRACALRARLPITLKLAEYRQRQIYKETDEAVISAVLKSFSDFVELCERKEKETGEPVEIIANY
jgi:hypothetical protein